MRQKKTAKQAEYPSPTPSSACDIRIQKEISRDFSKFFLPENSFGKTESAFRPATLPEYLYEQNPKKKKIISILEKIHPRANPKSKKHFFFGVAE